MPRARPSRSARGLPLATAGWTRRSPSWRTWPGCRSPSTRRSSSVFTSGSRTPWATPARVSGRYRTAARASWAAERHPGKRMGSRRRLDAELVRRGLARSREQAASLVADGRVLVAGQAAGKPATQVTAGDPILITGAGREAQYASRGGTKLAGALAAFPGLRVAGRRCLDAGAPTGGLTDGLLRAGTARAGGRLGGRGRLRARARRGRAGREPAARPGRQRRVLPLAAPGRPAARRCRAAAGHRGRSPVNAKRTMLVVAHVGRSAAL